MSSPTPEFIHRFVPATDSGLPTLLLLHGTGGNEESLSGMGSSLLPGAALLSPRGKVLENGMPRFFRRLAEGVFDEADLIARAAELAGFIRAAATLHNFDVTRVVAVGYSNGANIAAALLLLHAGVLAGAVLLRAMLPLEPATLPRLTGVPVYMAAGRFDPLVPEPNVMRLEQLLTAAGVDVTLRWEEADHSLTRDEIAAARLWLAHHFGKTHGL